MPTRRFTALLATALSLGAMSPVRALDGEALEGVVRVAGRAQKDVVVWLEGVPSGPADQRPAVLDQRNLTFSPHVLAVRVGTQVRMPNNDRVFHNVFSFKDGKRFDLGLYPVGTSRVVTFDRTGVSRIFCNLHPNMAAYVVSVDSDHFAVSDGQGTFTIAGVPPGSYTVHTWRAGQEPTTERLIVEPGKHVEIDLP